MKINLLIFVQHFVDDRATIVIDVIGCTARVVYFKMLQSVDYFLMK